MMPSNKYYYHTTVRPHSRNFIEHTQELCVGADRLV